MLRISTARNSEARIFHFTLLCFRIERKFSKTNFIFLPTHDKEHTETQISRCFFLLHERYSFFFRGGARDWGEKEKNFSQKAGIFIGYSCSVDREKSNGKHWFVLGFVVIKIVLCLCAKASCEEGFHLLRDCSREWICNSRAEWKRKIYIHKQAKREEFNIQHVEVVNALIMKLCVDARKRY